VNCADDILAACMVNGVQGEFLRELAVSGRFVRAKQADLVRDGFANEPGQRLAFQVVDDARDDVAFALHRPNDDRFASATRSAASVAALILVPVLGEAADESFVNLDDTAKLFNILAEGDADFVTHKPSGLIRTEAQIPLDLEGAHALLADKHQVNNAKPVFERLIRVLKDCAGQVREAIASRTAGRTLRALPMMAGCERINLGIAATRANDAFRPTANDQISDAVFRRLKQRIELRGGQLVNCFGLLCAGHNGFLLSNESNMA
jgi:hypothetical protein